MSVNNLSTKNIAPAVNFWAGFRDQIFSSRCIVEVIFDISRGFPNNFLGVGGGKTRQKNGICIYETNGLCYFSYCCNSVKNNRRDQ